VRQVIRAAGEIVLTAGAICLLFIGYLVWGTGVREASAQRQFSSDLAVLDPVPGTTGAHPCTAGYGTGCLVPPPPGRGR
jgi:hypothetical protein